MGRMPPSFDEDRLAERLAAMPRWARLAFGLDVCEGLLALYRRYAAECGAGGEAVLRDHVDLGWSLLIEGHSRHDCRVQADEADMLAPDTEEVQGHYVSDGLDAAVAVSRTMSAFADEDDEVVPVVVEVAGLARDAADRHVQDADDFQAGSDLEEAIATHPIMRAALDRQADALEILERPGQSDPAASINALRDRSVLSGPSPTRI